METIRFKNDSTKRKRLFVGEAMSHPAKGHIAMWEEMVLRYSKEGDWVLDPMAGIGTSLIAALLGRNVVCVELEQHFVDPMRRSWEKMRTMPMLGYEMGHAVILRGDARCLPLLSVDAIITSPPYENAVTGEPGIDWSKVKGRDMSIEPGNANRIKIHSGYTRPPVADVVITSPPYEGSVTDNKEGPNQTSVPGGWKANAVDKHGGYTRPHSQDATNIGNQRSEAYWTSMHQVYAECWRVLRPGGIMALVLKGFTRDVKYVDLSEQTEALLLEAGWQKYDHWRRELWSLSFWRVLQKRRDPVAFDGRLMFEEVLAFRKLEGVGGGEKE